LRRFLSSVFAVIASICAVLALPGAARGAELPRGWSLYTAGAYQIGAPGSWSSIPIERAEIERAIGVVSKGSPDLASTLQHMVDSGQYRALRLLAVNMQNGESLAYATTLLPLKLTPRQLAEAATELVPRQLPGASVVDTRSDASLNGRAAARVEYELALPHSGGARALRGVQYYLPIGSTLHIITVTGAPSAAFVALADTIAGTFDASDAQPDAARQPQAKARVNGNVRAAPSVRARIATTVKAGDMVTLLGKNSAASWFRVRTSGGVEGWVSATIVNVDAATARQLAVIS
jgi:hypothetical protein